MRAGAMILAVDRRSIVSGDGEYRGTRDNKKQQIEGIERLAEDVWLIPLPQGLPFFAKIASVADHVGYPYRVIHIEHDVSWVRFGGPP